MADFTEMIIGGAQKSVSQAGSEIADNYQKGAQLALAAEEVQMKKQMLAKQKADLENTKVEKFTEALFKVQNFKDPAARKNYLKNYLPKVRDMYGLTDAFSDESLGALNASDEDMGRAYTLNLEVMAGRMKPTEAIAIFNDPLKRADIQSTPPELRTGKDFTADEAFKTYQDNEAKKAQMAQSASQFQQGQTATASRDRMDRKEKLDKKLTDLGIADAVGDINTLNAGIPGGIKGYKGGEIPGISGEQSKMPASELSGQAASNRQALQRLVNIKLKQMSGSAVMDQELARTLDALGVSTTYNNGTWAPVSNILTALKKPTSAEKVLQGVRYLERSISNEQRKLQNTYGKDLYDEVTSGTNTESLAPTKGSGKQEPPPDEGRITKAVDTIKAKFPQGFDAAKLRQALAAAKNTPAEIEAIMKKLGSKQ